MFACPHPMAITGTGYALGDEFLDNAALAERHAIRIKPSFIKNSIGINSRYFLSEGRSTSDIATEAAKQALSQAGLPAQQLSRIIVATSTPDYLSPSTACVVQHKLGASGFPAHDVCAACSGFVYAVDQALRYLATGDEHVLVIGADVRSRTLDFSNRRTAFLYGDGAGAVVISRLKDSGAEEDSGFLASYLYADGAGHDAVYVPSVGTAATASAQLVMPDGQRVSHNASVGVPGLVKAVLSQAKLPQSAIDFYLFHQPNLYLLQSVCEDLAVPADKTHISFPDIGNTVAASIPIALAQAHASKKLQLGDRVLLCAMGAGFTGGAQVLRWSLPS
ncbi:3-oxoacyl-ACP synthase III family protein [Pelomonas sp. BJYL3]|uniref:3-oxoacyl-ACP synthase III family protein n=1 Tax=Pelomonas sp. BJYL3 TaxID=2976697 RepID=UPI0022B2B3A6|nr:ketoacyl-ACP synthase III [Pelomonas sp. BJYL3]